MSKILEKNLFFHSSGDNSKVTTDLGDAFSVWSVLPHRIHFVVPVV